MFSKSGGFLLPSSISPLIKMKNHNFMRGSNIFNGWVIYDEFQNFNRRTAKLLITRGAEGTKTIICGDIDQIDNHTQCTPDRNGLVYIAHGHLQLDHPHVGIINLPEPRRNFISNISTKLVTYYRN